MSLPADGDAYGEARGGASWWARAECARPCAREIDEKGAQARCQRLGWLLARAHGYLVRDLGGAPLGRLAALSYGADDRWPRALIVRPHGLRGLVSRRTCELAFSTVLAVAPTRREVRVMADRWPAASALPERSPDPAGHCVDGLGAGTEPYGWSSALTGRRRVR